MRQPRLIIVRLIIFKRNFTWTTVMRSDVANNKKLAKVLSSIYGKERVMWLRMIAISVLGFRSAKHNCFDEEVFCAPSAIRLALLCLYLYSVYRILIF